MRFTIIIAVREGEQGPEFLMVRNRERGWELPGGKFEGKEGPLVCAQREFIEETGHYLDDPWFLLKQERPHGTAYLFRGALGAAVPDQDGPEEKISELGWFRQLPKDCAFPDDPYDAISQRLGFDLRTGHSLVN